MNFIITQLFLEKLKARYPKKMLLTEKQTKVSKFDRVYKQVDFSIYCTDFLVINSGCPNFTFSLIIQFPNP